jgi:glucose-1-phosphate thymidylyltransferase
LGTRLFPATRAISKQIVPVYDKPMIYYPLSVLMLAGIREIMVITASRDQRVFSELLGDGSDLGLSLRYAVQPRPEGLAQAFHIARDFIGNQPSALILGDNIFYGQGLGELVQQANHRENGATIFAYDVANPGAYGVVSFDKEGLPVSIEEKPVNPKSRYAVTGLYFYDAKVVDYALGLTPSARGELEISDLNRRYLETGDLHVELMGRGYAWLDTGTHASLLDASLYVKILEERQGFKICCPEEVAWRMGFITAEQLRRIAAPLEGSGYGEYLLRLIEAGAHF